MVLLWAKIRPQNQLGSKTYFRRIRYRKNFLNKEENQIQKYTRHFMVQEGENLQLYIAHKGTQYYEKINSIINSAKNVLMKFLPEEEIEKILHNPLALSKMTPEDISRMRESAEKKLQALKDKMNNIKALFINAGASLTTDNIQELMTTLKRVMILII